LESRFFLFRLLSLYQKGELVRVFDDIDREEAREMAEYIREHHLETEDGKEAGREWRRHNSKSAAWEYLRECAELEEA
jgi:hypothetical protein